MNRHNNTSELASEIPILCSCGASIECIYRFKIKDRLMNGESLESIMDDLKVKRECCRTKFTTMFLLKYII